MVDIIASSDGSPHMLGVTLGEACKNIMWGDSVLSIMIREKHADLDLRMCREEGLSGMILGFLFAEWDRLYELMINAQAGKKALHVRHSHNQFRLQPSAVTELGHHHYTYLVEFRDHPETEYMGNPMVPWIEVLNGSQAGFPEDFIRMCQGDESENQREGFSENL
jgi:hypothetical protein